MAKFKEGDLVYATKNRFWGLGVLKVVGKGPNTFICANRQGSTGGFIPSHLVLVSKAGKKRIAKIKKVIELKKKIELLEKELFGR